MTRDDEEFWAALERVRAQLPPDAVEDFLRWKREEAAREAEKYERWSNPA